eukprot:625593-Pyramimonas_sp.AAC.1
MRGARAALVTPLGLDLQAHPQETERGIQSVSRKLRTRRRTLPGSSSGPRKRSCCCLSLPPPHFLTTWARSQPTVSRRRWSDTSCW